MTSFTFFYEIERGDAIREIEVTYTVTPFHRATYGQPAEGDEVEITDIFPNVQLTDAEEDAILDAACARSFDDMANYAADLADYLYQQYRDRQLEREMF